jgi:hypothetical protein
MNRAVLIVLLTLISMLVSACGESDIPSECIFQTERSEGRMDIQLILYGDARTMADLYRDDSTVKIASAGMLVKQFIDTNDKYVHQVYNTWDWEPGRYRIEYRGDRDSGEQTITLEEGISLRVDINCP